MSVNAAVILGEAILRLELGVFIQSTFGKTGTAITAVAHARLFSIYQQRRTQ
jgi:hypothetical protein